MTMAKSHGRTPSGRELTDEVLDEMVAEAEAGYDLSKAKLRPGPGRRPTLGDEAAPVESVRLGAELGQALAERAATEGTSKAEVIRRALRAYLKRSA
jgi:hypothetical protein